MNDNARHTTRPILYRAPFVVPVVSPLIADAGVLVADGRVVAVDRFRRLRDEASRVVDLDGRLVMPALINCHCHLELSHLAGLGRAVAPNGSMTGWIRQLLSQRAAAVAPEVIAAAGRQALEAQYLRGTVLVADIGNLAASAAFGQGGALAETIFFHEVLGSTATAAKATLTILPAEGRYTAHAPYSCHPMLLKAVKERAARLGELFSIHLAESAEEVEFLQTGHGPFRDFLLERLRLTGLLTEGVGLSDLVSVPNCSPVAYLDALGLLDQGTLAVHLVQVSPADIELLAQRRVKVCLCPASNRTLGVGTAPAPEFFRHGILPALGTDSLASNERLDLWHEMRVLQDEHPGLDPERIVAMATLGGAQALGCDQRLGAIRPGLDAKLLSVPFAGRETDIFSHLVSNGATLEIAWLEDYRDGK